jgi:hypothetical protein
MNLFDNNSGAEFSKCGNYRYKLWRIWDGSKPLAMCIGLNPSTANANKNDQTISYLIKMLTILGYGGFYMMNLFAIISSKPDVLLTHPDPIGDNDEHLDEVREICEDVIFCWGNFKQAEGRIKVVAPRFPNALCFGTTANGKPFHPLAMMPRNGRDPNNPKLSPYKTMIDVNADERSVARKVQ